MLIQTDTKKTDRLNLKVSESEASGEVEIWSDNYGLSIAVRLANGEMTTVAAIDLFDPKEPLLVVHNPANDDAAVIVTLKPNELTVGLATSLKPRRQPKANEQMSYFESVFDGPAGEVT